MNRQITGRNGALTLMDGDYGINGFVDRSGNQPVAPRADTSRLSGSSDQARRDAVVGAQIRVAATLGCLAFWLAVIGYVAF